MAIVDAAYEKWKKDFEAECPGLFKEGVLTGPETALRRDLMRTAYMAGKKAARQPVGQEPAFFVNRWEMEHGTASGLVAMRTGKHLGIRDFFTVPLYAAPTAQCAGEPVAWMTHHDEPMLFPTAAEAAAYCEDDEQPVPLFRSPAQAVDLGQFRQPVQDWLDDAQASMEEHGDYDGVFGYAIEEGTRLLALIDSQAVGNG
ncbi:hypothetical protein JY438_02795 [Stenotrophomonas maltophilia]|nr:hypothetical protein [Stenotrophomonas maltophilia]